MKTKAGGAAWRFSLSYGVVYTCSKEASRIIGLSTNVKDNEPDYPSTRLWIADCTSWYLSGGFDFKPRKSVNQWDRAGENGYCPLLVHSKKANAAFLDGHVAGIGLEYGADNSKINFVVGGIMYMKYTNDWFNRVDVTL